MGRGARILLYASLALNLVIAGLVAGALIMASPGGQDRRPPRSGETGLGPLLMALAPEDRRALGREMRRTLRDERGSRGEQRARMERLAAILGEDPLDEAELSALVREQLGEATFRLSLAGDVFLERVVAMGAAERAALGARLSEALDRPRGGPKRNGDGEGG